MRELDMISKYRALSFDCYGTLIDWETGILSKLREIPRSNRKDQPDAVLFTQFLEAEAKVIARLGNAGYEQILNETYIELASGEKSPELDELAVNFARSAGTWSPFTDTNSTLRELDRSFTLAILSNIHDEAMKESLTQLDAEFEIVLTAEEIGSFKPQRRNFERLIMALRQKGIDKNELLHVSVSKFHDLIPISKLGVDTCWINRAGSENGTLGRSPAPVEYFKPTYSFMSLEQMKATTKVGPTGYQGES